MLSAALLRLCFLRSGEAISIGADAAVYAAAGFASAAEADIAGSTLVAASADCIAEVTASDSRLLLLRFAALWSSETRTGAPVALAGAAAA